MKKSIIVASVICLMLTGCGKKDNVAEDFSNIQGEVSTEDVVENTEEAAALGEAEHRVNYTVTANPGIEMVADLTIDTRIPEKVSSMKVEKAKIDDEYLANLASEIFDRGQYEVLPPSGCEADAMEETLADIRSSAEQKANEYDCEITLSQYYNILSETRDRIESGEYTNNEQKDGQIIFREDFGSDLGTGYEEFAYIKGTINNKTYILIYSAYEYSSNYEQNISIVPYDGTISVYNYVASRVSENLYGKNTMNYESAAAMAEEYVQQLGFSDYAIAGCYEILCNKTSPGIYSHYDASWDESVNATNVDISDSIYKSGYRFVFTPGIDGMQVSDCGYAARTTSEYDPGYVSPNAWEQPQLVVEIDETGLRSISTNNIYEIEEILANDSSLLTFEQADEYARKAYEDNFDMYIKLSDISLEYIIVQYDDGSAMVPAWVYYNGGLSGDRYPVLAINALDGKAIYMNYNVLKF